MVMDRLSDLPESLLCHILSFLPTKFSVATSVLSKRWRYLWTDVPVLDLDNSYHESINSSGRQFSDIINIVLMRHNHRDLHTFRLTLTNTWTWDPLYEFADYQIETWISNVAARRLQNLHIGLDDMECCIPPCLFTCKTLVQLSLHKCDLETPTVLLPSLKKLHLLEVVCVYEESFSNLISGCPVLEELVIDWTMEFWPRDEIFPWENLQYRVSSPTIKSIKIVHTNYSEDDIEDLGSQYTMDMDTPALECLKIEGCLSEYISAPTLTSLVEADIKLTVFEDDEEWETFSFGSVLEFVDKLYNVESLCLRLNYVRSICLRLSVGDFTKFYNSALATSTVWFHNLKKLELAADWRLLLKFLEYAPNLQVLIIQKVDKCLTYSWEEPQQVHPCLTSHLTSIIIHIFEGTVQDLEMVRYFLRNAKILKTMVIYFRADSFNFTKRKEAQKSISLLERGSPTCKLRFAYDFIEPHTSTYITWCRDLNAFPSCREKC